MKKLTLFLSAMLLACATNLWAEKFSQTYSYGFTGWSLTEYTDKSSYYLVPKGENPSVATISGIFTDKKITSDVVVTLNVATYGNGNNPSASTFSLYTSSDCKTSVAATQSGTLPTSSSYTNVIYTVSQANAANLTSDLAIKITKPGKQIRLKSIKVEYETSTTLTAITISIPEDVQLKKEYIVGTGFDVTGIKAIATYDDASEKDVTEDVTWTLNPKTFESVAENASVKVTASIDGETSNELEITGITVRNLYNYTITWVVNGEDYNEGMPTTNVKEGDQITALPTAPANNTLSCSNVFVGWSTNNLGSTAGQSQPEDIFTSATAAPAITENTTFHAVFATADGEATEYLKETFDQANGTGGNDGKWSDNVASNKLSEIVGWTFENGYAANQCVKLGTSSKQGSATTPALAGLTGEAVLTFRAGAWDGDATTLNLSISEGSLSETKVTLTNAAFSEYSINITGATAQSKITFQGLQANKARFFLDDVVVKSNPLKDFRTNCEGVSTAIDNAAVETPAVKTIENGQLIIIRDGKKYNAMGTRLQ